MAAGNPLDPEAPTLAVTPPGASGGPSPAIAALAPSERYRIVGRLGVGGMGEVLSARDLRLDRDVAIKRLRADDPSAPDVARFVREAWIQGRLQHPAIVPIHDLAIDDAGRPFFAMKQLDGVTLAEVTVGPARPQWTRPRLLRAFVEVCLAIELAHTRGIVHRDLKPANIVLGHFGEVYVLDWGLARVVGDSAPGPGGAPPPVAPAGAGATAGLLGTPGYMPPEQIESAAVGPASDIYALGCTLFEILAGTPLHPRDATGALASTMLGADARPSLLAPDAGISPELDAICVRATAMRASDRFPSARALADAVQDFLDGDRDLALRREIARGHLADARAALARSDDDADRREAMRAAARALALDPASSDAADLVSHLVLAPPRTIPREVRDRLAELDDESTRTHARSAAIALAAGFAFALPIFIWIGIKDWMTMGVLYAAVAGHLAALFVAMRTGQPRFFRIMALAFFAIEVGCIGRLFNPFVFGTGLAVVGVALAGAHPRMSRTAMLGAITIYLGAVLVPWALELVGVLAPTYEVLADGVLITPAVLAINRPSGELGILLYVFSVIGITGVLTWRLSERRRNARDQLELQAWHLRQLLPAAASPAPAQSLRSSP